jgi:phospholipase C
MSTCTKWVDDGKIACTDWTDHVTSTCNRWADEGYTKCQTWADEGSAKCQNWKDEGSNQCQSWADRGHNECCDWAPCSWFCDAFYWVANWVCQGWYWVANVVCQAWYWVAKWVCKASYWVANIVCTGFMWIVNLVCLVWSWVADWVCIAWDGVRCVVSGIFKGQPRPSGQIQHVFVLMLENRAFDHMLGFLELNGTDAVTGLPTNLENLIGNPQSNIDPATSSAVFAQTPADFKISAPDVDPQHEFKDAVVQLCGKGAAYDSVTQTYPPINNSGFIASYQNSGDPTPVKIMRCFSPDQVPVITTLARSFAVCDHWFSSVPGPTWPNRFFIHAASSGGLDDSPSGLDTVTSALLNGYRFENGTIYDSLEDKCFDWNVFMGDELPQVFAISGMTDRRIEGHFEGFDEFADAVNDPDFSTPYVFIEPNYGNVLPTTPGDFTCGNSQHPLDDVTRGERLIKDVYETIRNSPHWNDSLLLITWDEQGGFFDHVPPPKTVSPGDVISDEGNNHNNFDFTQLGIRVSAVLVSPLIPANVIDHTVYDHTSWLATVEKLFGLPALTNRDRQANTLNHLLSLTTPRTDAPTVLPDPPDSGFHCDDDSNGRATTPADGRVVDDAMVRPVDPILRAFFHVAFLRDYHHANPLARTAIVRRVLKMKTRAEMVQYMQDVGGRLPTRKARKRRLKGGVTRTELRRPTQTGR